MSTQPWVDVTRALSEQMPIFPGQTPFSRHWRMRVETDRCSLSTFVMSSHCGTHMDAPLHFVQGGQSIDQAPLSLLMGKARLITLHRGETLPSMESEAHRLLIRSDGFEGFTEEMAADAIDRRIGLLGIDRLCIARDDLDTPVHRQLLGHGIWILESLDLSSVTDGEYDMICLPLKIEGNEGAPARVVLRRR